MFFGGVGGIGMWFCSFSILFQYNAQLIIRWSASLFHSVGFVPQPQTAYAVHPRTIPSFLSA